MSATAAQVQLRHAAAAAAATLADAGIVYKTKSVVCGRPSEFDFEDGTMLKLPCFGSLCVCQKDLAAFVERVETSSGVVAIRAKRCSDWEFGAPIFFIGPNDFTVLLNDGNDWTTANTRDSIDMYGTWRWSPTTHAELPLAGRKRAKFLYAVLKHFNLPALCCEKVLSMLARRDFASTVHICPLDRTDEIQSVLTAPPQTLFEVQFIKEATHSYDGATVENVWTPTAPAIASAKRKRGADE